MGDPNASIPTPQPVVMRPMFGAQPGAVGERLARRVRHLAASAPEHPRAHGGDGDAREQDPVHAYCVQGILRR